VVSDLRWHADSVPPEDSHHPRSSSPLPLVAICVLGFAARLALGMRTPLDGDEASLALAALHITHGQLALMEPNGHYLGALDAYVAAPFIALFGTTLVAVRLALALVGVLFILSMYWLGRILFARPDRALLTAAIAATFPLFGVYWAVKLRGGYAELPVFEALLIGLVALIGWRSPNRMRWWALLGFVAGVSLWSDLLALAVLAVCGVALLVRAPSIGWATFRRGGALSLITALVGLTPWLVFNVSNPLFSVHAIPKNYVSFQHGVSNILGSQLPIFLGGSSSCGHDVVAPIVTNLGFGILLAGLLWTRRHALKNTVSGHLARLEPLDFALLIIPATFVFVVLSRINYEACEPRYLMTLTVPVVIGAAALLKVPWPWRSLGVALGAVWIVVSGVAASGPLVDMTKTTSSGSAIVPADLSAGLQMIERGKPAAVWAQYWLARPLAYASNDTLAIGEYGGYVGFISRQAQVETAIKPSWVFVQGDSAADALEHLCASRHVTYDKQMGGGLVLYTNLSASIEPSDVFPPGS
jgi:4-amino-4-deoxy-L-arabinose transferase-like glycosyltransferase